MYTNDADPRYPGKPFVGRAQVATSLGHEGWQQGWLALPLVAAGLAEQGMWYTDAIVVGRLGGAALAAVSLAGMIFRKMIFIGIGVVSIVRVIVGNAFGGAPPPPASARCNNSCGWRQRSPRRRWRRRGS